jgi:hypothetical protein
MNIGSAAPCGAAARNDSMLMLAGGLESTNKSRHESDFSRGARCANRH